MAQHLSWNVTAIWPGSWSSAADTKSRAGSVDGGRPYGRYLTKLARKKAELEDADQRTIHRSGATGETGLGHCSDYWSTISQARSSTDRRGYSDDARTGVLVFYCTYA